MRDCPVDAYAVELIHESAGFFADVVDGLWGEFFRTTGLVNNLCHNLQSDGRGNTVLEKIVEEFLLVV